jgi:hypothetical protein
LAGAKIDLAPHGNSDFEAINAPINAEIGLNKLLIMIERVDPAGGFC